MNIDYDNELNVRIMDRVQASHPLQPLYDPRPSSTKYTFFQTTPEPDRSTEPLHRYKEYSPEQTFHPGSRGPVDYYAKKIDTESKLRSQFAALQKADAAVYVPETNSDLYVYSSYKPDPGHSITQAVSRSVSQTETSPFFNMTRLHYRQPIHKQVQIQEKEKRGERGEVKSSKK
jgi:hypothetical protein